MSEFQIVIQDNVEIPKREANFGPRGSQYPLAQMHKGQSFALIVTGKEGQQKEDGTPLTVAQDAERKARQKQSYFSSLGKRLNIAVVTRFTPATGELRVWHDGPRPAAAPKDAPAPAPAAVAAASDDVGPVDLGDE